MNVEKKSQGKSIDVKKLVFVAVLTALVVVLQFFPVKFGTFELALSVPVIVVGAALFGLGAGTWLGLVFGFVVLMLPGTVSFLTFSPFGTIVTVLLKGVLAGFCSALIYKPAARINKYFACLVAAVVATFTNTLVFLIGSLIFFESNISVIINTFISINFLIELAVNVVFVPTIYRIIEIGKKKIR